MTVKILNAVMNPNNMIVNETSNFIMDKKAAEEMV